MIIEFFFFNVRRSFQCLWAVPLDTTQSVGPQPAMHCRGNRVWVLDAAFGGPRRRPHPKPAAKLACKTLQKIDNIVTNATYSIFYRAVFYSLS